MRKRIAALIAALTSGLALAACSNPASGASFAPDSQGNLSIWDRDVTVDQTLTGALRVSNGNVVVNGTVEGEVNVWNGSLTVNGEVGRDVHLSQGAFKLTERGRVHGTVHVYDNGQGVEADGQIGGDLQVSHSHVVLGPSCAIGQNVKVWSGSLDRRGGSTVRGSIKVWS